jgi:hypothetical protein
MGIGRKKHVVDLVLNPMSCGKFYGYMPSGKPRFDQ